MVKCIIYIYSLCYINAKAISRKLKVGLRISLFSSMYVVPILISITTSWSTTSKHSLNYKTYALNPHVYHCFSSSQYIMLCFRRLLPNNKKKNSCNSSQNLRSVIQKLITLSFDSKSLIWDFQDFRIFPCSKIHYKI